MTTITAPRGTDCQHGSALNGGPVTSAWLKGDWQTREALAHQQSVHNQ